MTEPETAGLLDACAAHIDRSARAIDGVLNRVQSFRLLELLKLGLDRHRALGREARRLLEVPDGCAAPRAAQEEELAADGDAGLAALIARRCRDAADALTRCLAQQPDADEAARHLAQRLIELEDRLAAELRPFM